MKISAFHKSALKTLWKSKSAYKLNCQMLKTSKFSNVQYSREPWLLTNDSEGKIRHLKRNVTEISCE